MRLFFALPLPPDHRAELARWQQGQPGIGGWSRPDGLHLTLAFLGSRAPADLAALQGLGAAVTARHRPLRLETAGLGGFPRAERARVLWLGIAPAPALEALAADLRAALAAAGEAFDAKPFRAHITLARARRARPVDAFAPVPPATLAIPELVLFESRPGGWYAPLGVWKLGRHAAGV